MNTARVAKFIGTGVKGRGTLIHEHTAVTAAKRAARIKYLKFVLVLVICLSYGDFSCGQCLHFSGAATFQKFHH